MRRVIDDSYFEVVADTISKCIRDIPAETVSEYNWGMYRASVGLVKKAILDCLDDTFGSGVVSFGKNEHAHGIGNNNAYELIVSTKEEQHICGHLNLVDNMYGGVIAYVTDIDNARCGLPKRKISGCDKNSKYDMEIKRFSGWEDENDWETNVEERIKENLKKFSRDNKSKSCKEIER